MPLAELDALRRQLDQASERWFDGESRTWAPAIEPVTIAEIAA
jgi:hypothetical protein